MKKASGSPEAFPVIRSCDHQPPPPPPPPPPPDEPLLLLPELQLELPLLLPELLLEGGVGSICACDTEDTNAVENRL